MVVSWEHFHHGADIGVRGRGATLAEALEGLAVAMIAVIATPERVRPEIPVEIRCEADADDLLAMDWLNELVYEMDARRMLFSRFAVRVRARAEGGGTLAATAWGEGLDVTRHEPAVEVKGATMTALRAGREVDGSWIAQCVVDV